ncbi:MAG TPA: hypothetical protein VLH15_06715 [Dehalococcoidales bacterium]|nr:hypothetical protein [Dehalococcoidales bacterium]
MFLFRKKKENTEASTGTEKAPVITPGVSPEKAENSRVKEKSGANTAKAAPVRVVVPGSKNKKDAEGKLPATATGETGKSQNPDEIADSLLVRVEPNPAISQPVDEKVVAAVLKADTKTIDTQVTAPTSAAGLNSSIAGKSAPATGNSPVPSPVLPVSQAAASSVPGLNAVAAAGDKEGQTQKQEKPAAQSPSAAPAGVAKTEPSLKPPESNDKKPAVSDKKENKAEDKGNTFSNLFGKTEVDEETPLDRLIKSLPDVSIEEVASEAEEVKSLMVEWMQSQRA